jgi:hypothetical protein
MVTNSQSRLFAIWEVFGDHSINTPHSFFWFAMDYLEFRDDGEVWALMWWPPGSGSELKLNKIAEYTSDHERQITFWGSCRHQDKCSGTYSMSFEGETLYIQTGNERMVLKRFSDPSVHKPPMVNGPSATATPAPSQ